MPYGNAIGNFFNMAWACRRQKMRGVGVRSADHTEFQLALVLRVQPTMLRLSQKQRRLLSDKVPDLANLVAGALVFGQFVDPESFSADLMVFGVTVWTLLTGFALALTEGREE